MKMFSVLIYWLLTTYFIFKILIKERSVTAAFSWILTIYTIPVIGIIVYFLFGELNIGKDRYKRSKNILYFHKKWINNISNRFSNYNTSEVSKSLFKLCENRQGIRGLKDNYIELLINTNYTINTLIKDIENAQSTIHMIFYIWKTGGIINTVSDALIKVSNRGVKCKIMLDAVGSISFFNSCYYKKMKSAGIKVIEVLNIHLISYFFRRMDIRQHRKIILIDDYISYTGSMNMVDTRFFKKDLKVGPWIDVMVRIIGPVTFTMACIFYYDWEIETKERIMPIFKKIKYITNKSNQNIQVIASGPGLPEGLINQTLMTAIYSARKQLIITTPYFVPSNELLNAICTAAQRGIDVNIVIPRKNNSFLVTWASRSLFSRLLSSGVKIYLFKSGFLHTKSMLVDGKISIIGTANFDIRSLWINFEVTLIIDDTTFSNNLLYLQKDYISDSKILDIKTWCSRPYWQHFIERLFYLFSPLL